LDRFITVQGFAANHEQGRVNRVRFVQRTIRQSLRSTNRPDRPISQEKFQEIFRGIHPGPASRRSVSDQNANAVYLIGLQIMTTHQALPKTCSPCAVFFSMIDFVIFCPFESP
jgi:hypothetical protein